MKIKIFIFILIASCFYTCSKEQESPKGSQISGTLYYEWAGHIFGYDLGTDQKFTFFEHTNDLNGWDVSRDGKILLTSKFIPGRTDVTQYTLSHAEDGNIISQFEYFPLDGERDNIGILSPDNSLIAIKPTRAEGIVIVNTEGEVLHHLEGVNGEKINQFAEVLWLPGNVLVFTHQQHILRTDPPYNDIEHIKEMDYELWGNLHASFDGERLSLKIGNHLYLMNIDGSDLKQITESNHKEREAVFSPDGRHLLVGTDFYPGVFSKGKWNLKIIPADGNTYQVDSDDSNLVRPVIPKGEKFIEQCTEIMLWR